MNTNLLKPAIWEPVKKIWQPGCSLEGWMYTVNDHIPSLGLRTIGYCMSWEDRQARTHADIAKYGGSTNLQQYLIDCKKFQHKFHEAPHHSRMEAIDCYREYLFDVHLRLRWHDNESFECYLCGDISAFSASIIGTTTQGSPIFLCNQHSTREKVKEAFHKIFWVGEVTHTGIVQPLKQQVCSCPSEALFNFGCQCGEIK